MRLLILLLLGAAAQEGTPDGLLCLHPAPCRLEKRGVAQIDPAETPRPFTWVRGDGREVIAGVAPAGARTIHIEVGTANVIRAPIVIDKGRWPADVTVRLEPGHDRGHSFTWTVSNAAQELAFAATGVPAGKYVLEVAADHHKRVRQAVESSDESRRTADRIVLQPAPVLSGRVIDRETRETLGGSMILLPSGRVAAVAGAGGEFEIELADEWPDHLRVTREGHGSRIVAVPKMSVDAAFGDVELSVGSTLRIDLKRRAEAHPAEIELFLIDGDTARHFASRAVDASSPETVFEGLAPGRYRLRIRGSEPLQRYGVDVLVEEGGSDVRVPIALDDAAIRLTVSRRQARVASAAIHIWSNDGLWDEEITTNNEGSYEGRLWQLGEFTASVELPGRPAGFVHTTLHGDPVQWDIRLPGNAIHGIVADAKTNDGIARAVVFLRTTTAESETLLRTSSDEEGRFEYDSVDAGEQSITVDAPGYAAGSLSFRLDETESDRKVTMPLVRATRRTLRAVFSNGAPAAGAEIIVPAGRPRLPIITDTTGRAEITIADGAASTVYVLPREGSLAIASAGADASAEIVVTIPAGEATIMIRARDETMNGIPNVHVSMRYNSHLLPAEVLREMGAFQGRSFMTDAGGKLVLEQMPVGVYEFWPHFRAGESAEGAPRADAPVRIAAQPGLNSVVLTFARRKGT